ncbi:hypothetical protein GQ53DRAFT_789476 [Thozetella sp. PMI_491]|nr:hypothetical protein GQ53DRAFT_789476 [Thozetella sp. PMI_491]
MRPSASILGAALACCGFFLVSAQEDSTFTSIASGINPIFSQEKLYELTTNFWTNFMYPNNCAQAQAINSDLLAENVQGRIDLTRTFVGAELNTEYLFGLFCNLQSGTSFNVLGSPVNFTYTQFVGQGNLVANTVLIYFNLSSVGLISPVSIQSYINFDSCGRISQYDAVFKWMDWQFQTVFAAAAALLGTTNLTLVQEEVAGLLATNICGVADSYCTGSLQQYNSTEECMGFLTQQVPFGEAWQLGMNTLVCRDMHVNMVPFRPDVHCAHIGPTGGGYCSNDRTYATSVEDVFFNDEEAMLQIPS